MGWSIGQRQGPVQFVSSSLAVVGDSFTANGYLKTAVTEEWNARGYITHALALSGYRLNLVSGGMCAVGGSGITANINGVKFDTQLTSAIATGAKNLLVMGGVNDCNADVDPLVTFAAYVALVNRAVSAGMRVWICSQPCQNSSFVAYSVARQGAQLKLQALMRQWCQQQSPRNVVFIDSARACIDPLSTTASYRSGYTTDGLHPNNRGAYALGKEIAAVWRSCLPECGGLVCSGADNIAFSPLSTNLQPNSLMTASVAGLATGLTTSSGGPVNPAVLGTPSIEARSDGFGNNQVLPITFNSANEWGRLTGPTISAFNDGDILYAECEVTLANPVAVRGVRFSAQINGNIISRTAVVNQRDDNTDVAYLEGFTIPLRTPPIKYDASVQGATHNAFSTVTASSSGAGSCLIKVGQWAFKKV